jgi:calmodulin
MLKIEHHHAKNQNQFNISEFARQNLTKEMLLEAEDTFRMVCDSNGFITHEKLNLAFKALGLNLEENKNVIEDVAMDLDKFLLVVYESMRDNKWIANELTETYNIFDCDGNGCIDPDEVRRVFFKLGENITDSEINDQMREYDIDGDCQVFFLILIVIFLFL